MSMRISRLCLSLSPCLGLGMLLTLAACGKGGEDKVASASPDDRIDCAVSGTGDFTHVCAMEHSDDGKTLTIRHTDGGFRRFTPNEDGTWSAADGADAATVTRLANQQIEIAVGGDRYRLPLGK